MDTTFEAAALRCLDDVARFARSLAQNADDGEDLVQETYLRAFRSRLTYNVDGDMRRWLFTICKNVFLRGAERDRHAHLPDDDAGNETLAGIRLHNELVASGESDLLDRIDVRPAIIRALATLPAAYRVAIVLVDLEGHDYGDAAALLEIPIGTVRSRLFRARRLLQESLRSHARDAGIGRPTPHSDGSTRT